MNEPLNPLPSYRRLTEERDAAEVRREQAKERCEQVEDERDEWRERSECLDQQLGNGAVHVSRLEDELKKRESDAKYWEDRALIAESQMITLEEKLEREIDFLRKKGKRNKALSHFQSAERLQKVLEWECK